MQRKLMNRMFGGAGLATRRAGGMLVVAAVIGVVGAPAALGQDRGAPRGDRPQVRDFGNRLGGMGMGMEQVGEQEIDLMADVLEFDAPQRELAADLFVDLRESRAAKMVELRELMQGLRGGEGRPDPEAMEKVRTEAERIRAEVTELESRFYEDIQIVLTPEQRTAWSGFEKRRDRARALRGVDGAVDLQTIFESFAEKHEGTLDENALAGAKSLAERYAGEMDRQIAERAKLREEAQPQRGGEGFDREGMRERFEAMREANEKLGEISMRYADSIERTLPMELRESFRFEINRASMGGFMRRGNVVERLETVLSNEDLDPAQEQELRAIEIDMHKRFNALAKEIAGLRAQAREGRGGEDAGPAQRGGDRGDRGGQREAMESIRQKFEDIENDISERMRAVTGGDA